MNAHSLLIDAIRNRLVIEFRYDGVHRIVHPYVYGASQDGSRLLRAWQVKGRLGSAPEWRTYTVEKLSNISTTGEKFEALEAALRWKGSTMHTIYAQI